MINVMGKTIPIIKKDKDNWYFEKPEKVSFNIYKIKNLLFVKVSEIIDKRIPKI